MYVVYNIECNCSHLGMSTSGFVCLKRSSSPDNAGPMTSGLTVSGCFLGNWEKLNFIVWEEVCKGISIWKLQTRFYHKRLWGYFCLLGLVKSWHSEGIRGETGNSASSGVKRADTRIANHYGENVTKSKTVQNIQFLLPYKILPPYRQKNEQWWPFYFHRMWIWELDDCGVHNECTVGCENHTEGKSKSYCRQVINRRYLELF